MIVVDNADLWRAYRRGSQNTRVITEPIKMIFKKSQQDTKAMGSKQVGKMPLLAEKKAGIPK